MIIKKKILPLAILAALSSSVSAETVQFIDFNELAKYSGLSKGQIFTSSFGSKVKMYPWEQRYGHETSPYSYSDSGSFSLVGKSYEYDFIKEKDYFINMTMINYTSNSKELTIKNRVGKVLFNTTKIFGERQEIQFKVKGSELLEGLSILNKNIGLDDVKVSTESSLEENIVVSEINFDHISKLSHGTAYKSPFENESYLVYPYNQKAGTKNNASFSYGNTNAGFELFPLSRKTFDPNKKYEVSFNLGSSTGKSSNKEKVKFTVTTLVDKILYQNKNLFGQDPRDYRIIVNGADMVNGLRLRNSMVKIDDIIVSEVEGESPIKLHKNNSVVLTMSDLNNDGDYKDFAELSGPRNDGYAANEMFKNSGYNTNLIENISTTVFRDKINRVIKETDPNGILYVFVGGHMSSRGDFSFTDKQLPASDLKYMLDKHNGKKVVIFENCGSGSALQAFKSDSSYTVISSTGQGQVAWETPRNSELSGNEFAQSKLVLDKYGDLQMGVFSYYMFEGSGLYSNGQLFADTNGDGNLSAYELYKYAAPKTKSEAEGHSPQSPMIHIGDKDVIIFKGYFK